MELPRRFYEKKTPTVKFFPTDEIRALYDEIYDASCELLSEIPEELKDKFKNMCMDFYCLYVKTRDTAYKNGRDEIIDHLIDVLNEKKS